MLKNFYKYQSLGNDFILFDWYKKPETFVEQILSEQNLQDLVIKICQPHFGIGADGVLILKGNTNARVAEMLIFNKDGSRAEICLNGLRCVAQHLFMHYNFPEKFQIKAGHRIIECFVQNSKDSSEQVIVTNNVGKGEYLAAKSIKISTGQISGHCASIGNPHFIVFDKKDLNWLQAFGSEIESHKEFETSVSSKTNVEFVWQDKTSTSIKKFVSIVYERGCGITLACSSGAAAISAVLLKLGLVSKNEEFQISMPGGTIKCSLDESENITLCATSNVVFSGTLGR
ncbi:MAG: diaminopimelate epimerase [Candidatus Babeliales bacterium]|jgi:diaminopimelate epimerase